MINSFFYRTGVEGSLTEGNGRSSSSSVDSQKSRTSGVHSSQEGEKSTFFSPSAFSSSEFFLPAKPARTKSWQSKKKEPGSVVWVRGQSPKPDPQPGHSPDSPGSASHGEEKNGKMENSKKKEETVMLERDESLAFSANFQNSLQKRLQTKIVEFAKHYNEESIEAVTNFFADILSFATLWFLLVRLEIQINITKSFLLEVFFGLDDSKKSLLLLFLTDLLVGYHSPNIWELFFQTLFDHYGLPESQTTIFLLVATLPVLLDVLFKYLIFRHLNRASPATVATYHAMIE